MSKRGVWGAEEGDGVEAVREDAWKTGLGSETIVGADDAKVVLRGSTDEMRCNTFASSLEEASEY